MVSAAAAPRVESQLMIDDKPKACQVDASRGGPVGAGAAAQQDAGDDAAVVILDQALGRLELGSDDGGEEGSNSATATAIASNAKPVPLPSPALDTATAASASASPALRRVAELILSGAAKNVVVLAGAGLSVSAGIPDFRTPGTGLYSQLQRYRLPYPEAVFSIDFFRRDPKPFYTLAKELFPGDYAPTPAHFLLRLLADAGVLLRVFTQNIDGLEQLAGVPPERVVAAHGSFDSARCVDCGSIASMYAVQAAVHDGSVAECGRCGGYVKPDIVFFGEPLPARFHRRRAEDMARADLLLVIGTSLVVQPFASLVGDVGAEVPRVLVNRQAVGHSRAAKAAARAAKAADGGDGSGSSSSNSDGSDGSGSDSDSSSSSGSGLDGGFEWGARLGASDGLASDNGDNGNGDNGRDMLHLGDADGAAWALAALLGWDARLKELIAEDAAARAAAAAEAEGEEC